MNLTTTKQREQHHKEVSAFGKAVIFFLTCLAIIAILTGCAGTLEKSMAQCFAFDGQPRYTEASGVVTFQCERPASISTRAAR